MEEIKKLLDLVQWQPYSKPISYGELRNLLIKIITDEKDTNNPHSSMGDDAEFYLG